MTIACQVDGRKCNIKQKDLAEEYLTKAKEKRESVVDSFPELEWKGQSNFKYADTYIGRYNIDDFGIWLLRFNGKEIPLSTGRSLEEAKQAANEDYKKKTN